MTLPMTEAGDFLAEVLDNLTASGSVVKQNANCGCVLNTACELIDLTS